MRLQVLPIPGGDGGRFVLVADQLGARLAVPEHMSELKARLTAATGAEGVLVSTDEDIEVSRG